MVDFPLCLVGTGTERNRRCSFRSIFLDAWLGIGYDGLPGFFFVRHAGFTLDATNLLLDSTWIIVAMLGIDVPFGRYHRKRRGQHRRYFS